jgi:hypothetical protein
MTDFKLSGPRFTPPTLSVGGVVAPPVLTQSAPITSISVPSNSDQVDWGSAILTCLAVVAGLYFLNKKMEAKVRERENGY